MLDLIRGLPVRQADEVLQFTDRDVAIMVRKVLASAVANAQHNDEQDPEELYVKACFADEGPTLKRFTPRARGRAGRIKKRTCAHHDRGRPSRRRPPRGRPGPRGQAHRRRPSPWRRHRWHRRLAAASASSAAASVPQR